jgi:hypothetical protein
MSRGEILIVAGVVTIPTAALVAAVIAASRRPTIQSRYYFPALLLPWWPWRLAF